MLALFGFTFGGDWPLLSGVFSALPAEVSVWVTEAELPWMSESPAKVAVTVVDPAGNDEVVNVALPVVRLTVPRVVFPAVNVTGPPGRTVGDVILAVKVTACPTFDGLGEEVRVAELVA